MELNLQNYEKKSTNLLFSDERRKTKKPVWKMERCNSPEKERKRLCALSAWQFRERKKILFLELKNKNENLKQELARIRNEAKLNEIKVKAREMKIESSNYKINYLKTVIERMKDNCECSKTDDICKYLDLL